MIKTDLADVNFPGGSTLIQCVDDLLSCSFFKNKFIHFINLFLAALGFRCCTRAFSSCGEWGLLFFAVSGLLIAVASLVAEHGL